MITAHGHLAVRGTHRKTLEITADPEITARATCVIGVLAQFDAAAWCGPVEITLAAGGLAEVVLAQANPRYLSAERWVVRLSDHGDADTFAIGADRAAADLGRAFVSALSDSSVRLEVTVAAAGLAPGVLYVGAVPLSLPVDLRIEGGPVETQDLAVAAVEAEARELLADRGRVAVTDDSPLLQLLLALADEHQAPVVPWDLPVERAALLLAGWRAGSATSLGWLAGPRRERQAAITSSAARTGVAEDDVVGHVVTWQEQALAVASTLRGLDGEATVILGRVDGTERVLRDDLSPLRRATGPATVVFRATP